MRRPLRRGLSGVCLLAIVPAVLVAATWGWSHDRAVAQTPDEATPQLSLVRQTSWVGPEAVFEVVVAADDLPADALVAARLHPRVTDRSTLEAAAAGDAKGSTIFAITAKPVDELRAADGTITVSLPVSTDPSPPLGTARLASAGVYPFSVEVRDADGALLADLVTTMLRLGAPAADPSLADTPLAVGVVVPLEAASVPTTEGTPSLDAASADRMATTIGVVDDQSTVPLTLAPSPESLQLLSDADAEGKATVAGIGTGDARQVVAAPYAAIDTGAWVDRELLAEMDGQYAAGAATLRSLLGAAPSGTVAVLDPTVSASALDHLRGLGVDAVVVPSGQVAPVPHATFAEQFDLSTGQTGGRAVVGDDPTGARLADTADPVLAAHQALAELAYLDLADLTPRRGVAVLVPATVEAETLATFLDGLADPTGASTGSTGEAMVEAVTLDGLFRSTDDDPDTTSERGYQADVPADLGGYPDDLRRARASYGGLVSLVPSAPELTDPIDRTLLSSGARSLTPEQRDDMVAAAERSVSAATEQIVVTPEQIVTLTSSSGNVPLNLENRLAYEASVRIVLESAKLSFPDGPVLETTIAAAQTTTISLPVETRASGAFPLDVSITSADGALAVTSTRYTVRSTAISGVGLFLSVGAGVFLLVWWGRHFRTSRRARKLVGSNHPALSNGGPGGYAPPDTDPTEGR